MIDPCLDQNVGRQRSFWTTRMEVCGNYNLCGVNCSLPGLEYEDREEPGVSAEDAGRTIKTDDRLMSLILNILNTRARTDVRCPSPAAVFGHWSESYRGDGMHIGTRLWNAADKSYPRINDAVKAIQAAITADMAKLVALEIADTVDVNVTYRKADRVDVVIVARTSAGRSEINLSGTFVTKSWVWH